MVHVEIALLHRDALLNTVLELLYMSHCLLLKCANVEGSNFHWYFVLSYTYFYLGNKKSTADGFSKIISF